MRPRGFTWQALCAVLVLLVAVVTLRPAGAAGAVAADPQADVNFLGDAAHDAHSSAALGRDLTEAWNVTLASTTAYAVVSDDRVFVPAGSTINALAAHDGASLWTRDSNATVEGLAVVAGSVVSVDADGLVNAWRENDGARQWHLMLGHAFEFASPPTVSGGVVYVSAAGPAGTAGSAVVWAIDGSSGSVLWSHQIAGGVGISTSVADGVVVENTACDAAVGLDAASGTQLWSVQGACTAASPYADGDPVPLHDGRAWFAASDTANQRVADEHTGSALTTYNGRLPSFDGTRLFRVNGAVTAAEEALPALPLWTSLAADYVSPAFTASGMVAVIGAGPRVDVLDEADGSLVYSSGPLAGLDATYASIAAGDGLLIVNMGSHVLAFASASAGPPPAVAAPQQTPVTPGSMPAGARGSEWVNDGGDGLHDGRTADNLTATLTPAWTLDPAWGAVVATPAVVPGAVALLMGGLGIGTYLHVLDPTTGAELWERQISSDWGHGGSVAIGNGIVAAEQYFGPDDVYSLGSGEKLWGSGYYGDSVAPLQIDTVGHVWKSNNPYDETSGTELDGSLDGDGQVVTDGDSAYGTSAGVVASRSDSLCSTWSNHPTGSTGGGAKTPALVGGVLDVREDPSSPTASTTLDPKTGAVVGTLPSDVEPAGDGTTAFVTRGDDVIAVDPQTMLPHWITPLATAPLNQPVVAQGRLLVEETDGDVDVLDEATGALLGTTPTTPAVVNSSEFEPVGVAVAQGLVILPTSTGAVVLHDGATTSLGPPTPTTPIRPSQPGSPTATPTAAPTATPSAMPSALPGPLPSRLPTAVPSTLPSAVPSRLPLPTTAGSSPSTRAYASAGLPPAAPVDATQPVRTTPTVASPSGWLPWSPRGPARAVVGLTGSAVTVWSRQAGKRARPAAGAHLLWAGTLALPGITSAERVVFVEAPSGRGTALALVGLGRGHDRLLWVTMLPARTPALLVARVGNRTALLVAPSVKRVTYPAGAGARAVAMTAGAGVLPAGRAPHLFR